MHFNLFIYNIYIEFYLVIENNKESDRTTNLVFLSGFRIGLRIFFSALISNFIYRISYIFVCGLMLIYLDL